MSNPHVTGITEHVLSKYITCYKSPRSKAPTSKPSHTYTTDTVHA